MTSYLELISIFGPIVLWLLISITPYADRVRTTFSAVGVVCGVIALIYIGVTGPYGYAHPVDPQMGSLLVGGFIAAVIPQVS